MFSIGSKPAAEAIRRASTGFCAPPWKASRALKSARPRFAEISLPAKEPEYNKHQMRIARGLLVFVSIVALLALMLTPAANLLPFDLLIPFWFVIAAVVIYRLCPLPDTRRPQPAHFLASVPLRAPPVQ